MRLTKTHLLLWSLVAFIGGMLGTFFWNASREPRCPLEITHLETIRIGHHYHSTFEITNQSDKPVLIMRENEAFPDVFLVENGDLNRSVATQSVGKSEATKVDWAPIAANGTETVTITYHFFAGEVEAVPTLFWDPDLGFTESAARFIGSKMINPLPDSTAKRSLRDYFRGIGASHIIQGNSLTPPEICRQISPSPLREEAARFLKRPLPKGCQDQPYRVAYQVVSDYANQNLGWITPERHDLLHDDTNFLLLPSLDPSAKDLSVEDLIYRSDLFNLISDIEDEIAPDPFLKPPPGFRWEGS